MALRALVFAPRLAHQGRVQPLVRGEPLFDLGVTPRAPQLVSTAAATDMAIRTVGRAVELRVSFGQRARRELCEGNCRKKTQVEQQLRNRCPPFASTS